MENFDKLLYNNVDVVLLFAIIEAIIIVFLIYYLSNRKCNSSNARTYNENKNDMLNGKGNQNDFDDYWYKAYLKEYKELQALKNEGKSSKRNQHMLSGQSEYKNITTNNKIEHENQPFDNFSEYIKAQKEKGIYVKESHNSDGTTKSELFFEDIQNGPIDISPNRKYEFLEAANGGQFRKLLPSDEKSFFRTWEEDGVRMFEFHGNVERALANINAIFDDVCEIEGKQNGATQIYNITPGTLTSKLEVDKPAKIRLS